MCRMYPNQQLIRSLLCACGNCPGIRVPLEFRQPLAEAGGDEVSTERRAVGGTMAGADSRPVRFRDVFAVGEFRALFAAQLVTVVGDQLARVALSILVFDRTGACVRWWRWAACPGSTSPARRWPLRTPRDSVGDR